jgi:hypothetical protein
MKETQFRNFLKERKLTSNEVNLTIDSVKEFEKYLEKKKTPFKTAGLDALKDYISHLIEEQKNSMNRLIAITRYCHFTKKEDYYVYLVSTFGARNVLPDIGERVAHIAGEAVRQKVFEDLKLPPLGSSIDNYPQFTKIIMDRMKTELPAETCKKILTWNYHKVPAERFNENKDRFKKSSSIDEFLKNEHQRFVDELKKFMNEDRIWFEQKITPEVLEFMQNNQEICTGVRCDNRIYLTKIPYAPQQYLEETDSIMKRYYACHCPLVRSSFLEEKIDIPDVFCYCSAGYEKLRFDVIFEEPVEVEVIESVLKGDNRCRFSIRIPTGKMK